MKIAVVIGTRPEIIKMSPVIRYLQEKKQDFFVVHTGQHYDYELDQQFFDELDLPKPSHHLNVGSKSYRLQLGEIVNKAGNIFIKEKPDVVLVEGDTTSVLGGALAAKNLGVKVGHIEAGLRSGNMAMLEEINRIITDNISDYLFAPTKQSLDNIAEEGIKAGHILLTGNTIVDAVNQNLKIAKDRVNILSKLSLKTNDYIVATAHRAENVDQPSRLTGIVKGFKLIGEKVNKKIILPLHPRTAAALKRFNVDLPSCVVVTKPLGYLEFLQLLSQAFLVVTDSGGLQEEACILHVPCVTIRDETERPESIAVGANVLSGVDPQSMLRCTLEATLSKRLWENPYGDGNAAKKIINVLSN